MKHTAPFSTGIHRRLLLLILLFLFSIPFSFSQRIVGYVPEYRATMNIKYAFATHIIYAWLNADAAGNLQTNTAWFTTANFNTCRNNINAVPAASRPKLIISTGGWGEANIPTWIANNTARGNFITQMGTFIQNNNLDGFDLDWEFPQNATQRAQLTTFLSEMRTKLNT